MLAATLKIQGVASLGYSIFLAGGKEIEHNGHRDEIKHFKQTKAPFKGSTIPPINFTDHIIVKYGDYYFDPTGTSKIYDNINDYYTKDIEVYVICPMGDDRWIPGQKSYFNTVTGSLL